MGRQDKLNQAIKLVLELLNEDDDRENKYHLTRAHNELIKIVIKNDKEKFH